MNAGCKFKNEVLSLVRRWEGPGGESDLDRDELAVLAMEALEDYIDDGEEEEEVFFDADQELLDEINDEHEESGDDT